MLQHEEYCRCLECGLIMPFDENVIISHFKKRHMVVNGTLDELKTRVEIVDLRL